MFFRTIVNIPFYSPQLFEANLKTALFFFWETFCENKRFPLFLSLKDFYMFPVVVGCAWARLGMLGVLGRATMP